jgi:hypothetical protein
MRALVREPEIDPDQGADPSIKARLAELGAVPLAGSPAAFGKLIADESEKWGKAVRFAGMKPD